MCVYPHWILACSGSTASSVPHSQPPVILYAAGHNVMFLLFTRFVHIAKIEGILTNFTCSGSVSLFEPMPVISVVLLSYTCNNSTWTEIPIEAPGRPIIFMLLQIPLANSKVRTHSTQVHAATAGSSNTSNTFLKVDIYPCIRTLASMRLDGIQCVKK